MEGILQYYKDCLKVGGRMGRLSYLKKSLALILPLPVLTFVVFLVLGLLNAVLHGSFVFGILTALGWLACALCFLFVLIAGTTISMRRLHDMNLSAWWIVGFAAIEGLVNFLLVSAGMDANVFTRAAVLFFLILYFCVPGTQGENKYEAADEHPAVYWIVSVTVLQTLAYIGFMLLNVDILIENSEGYLENAHVLGNYILVMNLAILAVRFFVYNESAGAVAPEAVVKEVKKAPVKKSATKKPVAKKVASKKAPAKETATKKTTTTKKATTAKKTTAKKPVAKKPAVKKTVAKKVTPAKKTPAKKTTSKTKGTKE